MIPRFSLVWRGAATLCAGLALVACSSSEKPKIDENAFPADYRNAILKSVMSSQSYDPTNIREAGISDPTLRPVPASNTERYMVCVRFNARNDVRQYMGLADYAVYFYGGDITQFVKTNRDQCSWATYKPFPELEKICLGTKCT